MQQTLRLSNAPALRVRRGKQSILLRTGVLAVIAGSVAWAGIAVLRIEAPAADLSDLPELAPVQNVVATDRPEALPGLLDPMPILDAQRLAFRNSAPLDAAFRLAAVQQPNAPVEPPPLPSAPRVSDRLVSATVDEKAASPTRILPLPAPRPVEARDQTASATVGVASGPSSRRIRIAAAPPTPAVNPSFFERLFGVQPSPGPALGYAALDGAVRVAPNSGLDFKPASGSGTAVYDISARVVYLPDGERLEAHSGLGDKLDDPRYVHVRMLGATPPGTYDLTEREQLFHGVRALRLNPVGGAISVHGRAGLLAHTYMLGPNGDSNGCVSFRDYDKFLQAYLRGSVKRLVVVAGGGQDALRSLANGPIGARQRFAKS